MISLNEIAALINKIDAILAESEGSIYSARVDGLIKRVQMKDVDFLSEFVDFEIVIDTEAERFSFPYELQHKINGVTFFTLMTAADIAQLETTIPEQFDYISKRLQEE